MKLTKGMKKALSVLLAGAMVITGVNVTTKTADAELALKGPAVYKWTGTITTTNYGGDPTAISGDETNTDTLKVADVDWATNMVNVVVDNSVFEKFEKPAMAVVANDVAEDAVGTSYGVVDSAWATLMGDPSDSGAQLDGKISAEIAKSLANEEDTVSTYTLKADTRTITAIYVYDAAVITDANEDGSVFDELAAYEAPSFNSTVKDFDVKLYSGAKVKEHDGAHVTGDGVYSFTVEDDDCGFTGGWLALNLGLTKADMIPGFNVTVKAVTVKNTTDTLITEKTWAVADGKTEMCFDKKTTDFASWADIPDKQEVRVEIVNQWSTRSNENGLKYPEDDTHKAGINAFGEEDSDATEFGWEPNDVLTVYVAVKGTGKANDDANVEVPAAGTVETPIGNSAPSPSPATTTAPSTKGAVATKSAVASPATVKLSVAKKNKNVVVAAGKTKTVAFTAKAQAPATKAAVVTASVKGNKKVTAKIDGSKVKIKAAKKAVKGSAATVTLTSKNASGAAVKATIKVKVQNKAKKIKAAKKSVSIKKGKTAKVTIKVTKAENKKKAVTDTVTAKIKKIAKVTKTQVKKGKVIITLKAKKKGSAKLTVKVGKKAAKVNVKVK